MPSESTPPPPFGALLREHRLVARLTQKELAEHAQMSEHSISNLERGAPHAPRHETIRLLAAALSLSPQEEAHFVASARALRRPRATPPAAAATLAFPRPATPLIGREDEVAALSALLQTGPLRLLTLTGLGGVGKTHLALEVANQLSTPFGVGRTFVDLASIRAPELVLPAIAHALAVRERGSQTLLAALQAHLQAHRWLLLLDNFEQLLPAAPQVAALLTSCPTLSILVTSRAPLQVRGEQCYPLQPLTVPDAAQAVSAEQLALTPAVALLLARAQALRPDFRLTPANAATVAAICRQVDGLPLALELAAARLQVLPPQALLARLAQRLTLLTQGARDLPARQRTLRATLAWSYELLSAAEQTLFRRLAVFAGSVDLEALACVCQEAAESLLEPLTALLTHHLVQPGATATNQPRVRMLETVREYAWEQVRASGEERGLLRRYAAYYLAWTERAASAWHGPQQAEWHTRLEAEYEHLRAVLRWALDQQESETGLRLAGALWHFWYQRGQLTEGRAWLDQLLALPASDEPSRWRAQALHGAGWLAFGQGAYRQAKAYHQASLELSRALGQRAGIAQALNNLGGLARLEGDYAQARSLFEESLALYRALEDPAGIGALLSNLAAVAWEQGDYARAQALGEESLALDRATGNFHSAAITLEGLGQLAADQGDYARAQTWLEESLVLGRRLGAGRRIARALCSLGDVLVAQGQLTLAAALYQESLALAEQVEDTAGRALVWLSLGHLALAAGEASQAQQHYCASLAIHQQLGARRELAQCLEGLVGALLRGAPRPETLTAAVRLAAAAESLRKATGIGVNMREGAQIEAQHATLRALLDQATFAAAWHAGATMPMEAVIAEVLASAGPANRSRS